MSYLTAPELETHLRLRRAHSNPWRRAVSVVSGFAIDGCRPHQASGPAGGVAALVTAAGTAIGLRTGQGVDITQCSAPGAFVLFPTAGAVSIATPGGDWQAVDAPLQVGARRLFNLRLGANSRVVIFRPSRQKLPIRATFERLPALTGLIQSYLFDLLFYADEAHAQALTRDVLSQLARAPVGCLSAISQEAIVLDQRLIKAIKKMAQDSGWVFNLQELASHSGASERNLYYLMKHSVGLTPYRFYQRARLVRIRRRLVDCSSGEPHISRYAADEGFSHLGRFAALYREHFGELPSETVRWRQRALDVGEGADEALVPG